MRKISYVERYPLSENFQTIYYRRNFSQRRNTRALKKKKKKRNRKENSPLIPELRSRERRSGFKRTSSIRERDISREGKNTRRKGWKGAKRVIKTNEKGRGERRKKR